MEQLQGGGSKQFTLTMSVSPDGNPGLVIYDSSNSAVQSLTSTQSGSAYEYYSFYTLPETPGVFLAEWVISVSSKAYVDRELFEIVLTDADQSGRYSNPNDLRDLNEKIDTTGLTNREFLKYIEDTDTYLDTRLSKKYDTPFSTGVSSLPPVIGYLSKHLTLLDIMQRHSTRGGGDEPGWLTTRRERLESLLVGLESGSYSLTTSAGDVIGPTSDAIIWSSHEDYPPIFTLLDSERETVDEDLVDELEDERDL